jgi:hypothetical protein
MSQTKQPARSLLTLGKTPRYLFVAHILHNTQRQIAENNMKKPSSPMVFSRILVCIFLTLGAGCTPRANINGNIFIVKNSAEAVKLPLVDVYLIKNDDFLTYQESALDNLRENISMMPEKLSKAVMQEDIITSKIKLQRERDLLLRKKMPLNI